MGFRAILKPSLGKYQRYETIFELARDIHPFRRSRVVGVTG